MRADEYYNPKMKRHEHHYKDAFEKERVISSYRLEPTDQLPKGKRSGKSLREKEAELKVQSEKYRKSHTKYLLNICWYEI